jgi:hypothetical protein
MQEQYQPLKNYTNYQSHNYTNSKQTKPSNYNQKSRGYEYENDLSEYLPKGNNNSERRQPARKYK